MIHNHIAILHLLIIYVCGLTPVYVPSVNCLYFKYCRAWQNCFIQKSAGKKCSPAYLPIFFSFIGPQSVPAETLQYKDCSLMLMLILSPVRFGQRNANVEIDLCFYFALQVHTSSFESRKAKNVSYYDQIVIFLLSHPN